MAMRRMKSATKKAMKKRSMKKGKAMKSMRRRKAKRVSIFGKRRSVFSGKKTKTVGGLKRGDLKKNKAGKIVSRKQSDASRRGKGFKKVMAWASAFKQARRALGIKGFCPCGGKSAKGQALLKKTRSFYRK